MASADSADGSRESDGQRWSQFSNVEIGDRRQFARRLQWSQETSEEKAGWRLPPICCRLTKEGQTGNHLNPETADPPYPRKENKIQRTRMPGKRMVHIATGSLSLIVDICQSNKETLDKQLDTLSNLFL